MLLQTASLTVSYGGVRALEALSLTVDEGALVGLIGPNGAGKTTCIDAITGFTPYHGHVHLAGLSLDGRAPHDRARLGLARTFQSAELFDDLDVLGNLLVAAGRPAWWWPLADLVRPKRSSRATSVAVDETVGLLGIGHLLDRTTDELSEGERKLVALARALVGRPRLVLLDEPAAGLDTNESEDLGHRLRAIVDAGVSVLLVDHDMDLVLGVCDQLYVIEYGKLIATGTPSEIQHDERVVAAYLGTGAGTGAGGPREGGPS
jgi:branched-chain amino acid transport system ATP-binding protein